MYQDATLLHVRGDSRDVEARGVGARVRAGAAEGRRRGHRHAKHARVRHDADRRHRGGSRRHLRKPTLY